jgi:hypothetical protein
MVFGIGHRGYKSRWLIANGINKNEELMADSTDKRITELIAYG